MNKILPTCGLQPAPTWKLVVDLGRPYTHLTSTEIPLHPPPFSQHTVRVIAYSLGT